MNASASGKLRCFLVFAEKDTNTGLCSLEGQTEGNEPNHLLTFVTIIIISEVSR